MKYAVITGGSRGIGKAVAIQLAKDHQLNILFTYHSNEEAANSTLSEIESLGVKCDKLKFDVADHQATNTTFAEWEQENPDAVVEVVINNAGITNDNLFIWMNQESWKSVIDTSLNGFYNTTQYFLQKMLRNRYGRIINMVSVSGLKGTPGQTNYSAAKAAIIGATKALAQEIAKRNITVNAVAPGFITSDMTKDLDEKELKKLIPANRFGKVEEVAHLVSFLASQKSSYITGEVININGGIYS
ncbi:3-oxoacyl-ACP reductase FabG [Mesonia sp. K7]|uniref:3-oxoacyl-ACP reductase FabG n=1 Tax=Mesonia sp. K7 TaxID=2218606 RepID=UPI000DA962A4|nr:3-oxoacyl-ACP reductase FabG [Mesonia sp. K7]PZD76819.1 3-oxoacyl-ACP reductase FabG [Mesonia sp. K7]